MAPMYASATWQVTEGNEEEFVQRWREFLGWAREARPGFQGARLLRDQSDPRHFVSFTEWQDTEARDGWRNDPGFTERFEACRTLCDEFYGSDYQETVTV